MPGDPTYTRHHEHSQRDQVEWWLLGAGDGREGIIAEWEQSLSFAGQSLLETGW